MSWTRTYRPRSVAQLHSLTVRTSLENILKSDRFPQSFLFAGPKGTGKTSTSRILAALLNAPDNKKVVDSLFFKKEATKQHLNDSSNANPEAQKIIDGQSFLVHELDAASHRGIDDIRALKERIFLPPQQGSIAVYILDEVHMLTTEAFNAFLKLLEEPPEHVVFILATTELHKIPATIQSRCQLITFHKATQAEIVTALLEISQHESLTFETPALELIASYADGSFRDAVKLLELAHTQQAYSHQEVSDSILHVNTALIPNIITAVVAKSPKKLVGLFDQARKEHVSEQFLVKELFSQLHNSLLISYNIASGTAVVSAPVATYLLKKLTGTPLLLDTPIPHLPLELALLEIIEQAQRQSKKKSNLDAPSTPKHQVIDHNNHDNPDASLHHQQNSKLTQAIQLTTVKDQHSQMKPAPSANQDMYPQPSTKINDSIPQGDGQKLCDNWDTFIKTVARKNTTHAALLSSARPITGSTGTAQVAVYYSFHHEQLSKFQQTVASYEAVTHVAGGHVQLEFIIETTPREAELVSIEQKNETGTQILELLS